MRRLPIWLAAGLAAAAAITATTPAFGAPASQPPLPSVENLRDATQPPSVPPGHLQPMWRTKPNSGVSPNTIGVPGGYGPDELRAYLGLNGTGKGQTVAIVESWDVSKAVTDALAAYNNWYGLKPACSDTVTSDCFPLKIVAPAGTRTPTFANPQEFLQKISWQGEADLDVEVVHAIAPDAAITVVEAFDDATDSGMAALDYAASLTPTVISNSYGQDEFDGEQALDQHCQTALCVFSSGDAGNPGLYPAANPGVLAVGGTTLDMDPAGQIRSETAWTGSGGGISPFEPQPAYQAAADPFHTGRGVPDVSFDADPNSGIATYDVIDMPELAGTFLEHSEFWSETGGTSVGAPAWSAILAVAGEQRAAKNKPPLTTAQVQAAVYDKKTKGLADITLGANGICGPICTAAPGYDLVTGQGSPRPGLDTYLARL